MVAMKRVRGVLGLGFKFLWRVLSYLARIGAEPALYSTRCQYKNQLQT